jgi:putative acetyltransferase
MMPPAVVICQAEAADQIATACAMFREYAETLAIDLEYQGFSAELAALPEPYTQPTGALLLAYVGDDVAGCACLRAIDSRAGEMKRLYVRPEFRTRGVGQVLIEAVMRAARAAGYVELRLDTLADMTAAQALYRRLGFVEIPEYGAVHPPGTKFFAQNLIGDPAADRTQSHPVDSASVTQSLQSLLSPKAMQSPHPFVDGVSPHVEQ